MPSYRTFSADETRTLGAVVAERVLQQAKARKRTGAITVALRGDLGSGKTTFLQGFLRALGARGRVTSPTFVLMKRFPLGPAAKAAGVANAYHLDAYRIGDPSDASTLGLGDLLSDAAALVLIEWPERLKGVLPRGGVSIAFRHGGHENERVIVVS